MIKDEIGHANEHVLLNVRIELAIHLLQYISRRRVAHRLTAQNTPANSHDQGGRHALARNICDGNSEAFFIDFHVIEIIAANLARGDIYSRDLKSINFRRLVRQQNALNIAGDLQVVIKSLLFVRFGIDDGVVEGKGGLLGDRFKNDKIVLGERGAAPAVSQGKHTHVLLGVKKRRNHHCAGAKRAALQSGQLGRLRELVETNRSAGCPGPPKQTFTAGDIVQSNVTFEGNRIGRGLLQNVRGNIHQRRATFGDESGGEFCSGAVGQIERATVGIKNSSCAFHDQSMQIGRANCFAKGLAQAVKKIENKSFLDLDLFLRTLQPANAAALPEQDVKGQAQASDKQPEENCWREGGQLFPRGRSMKVLF